MENTAIVLIHPPVAKPCEPPAGLARLAGALRAHGFLCTLIDANLEGLHHLLQNIDIPNDTWSYRAHRNLGRQLRSLKSLDTYRNPDRYRSAVADIRHLLSLAGRDEGTRVGLADYADDRLVPVSSADLVLSAREYRKNPFYDYYQSRLWPRIVRSKPIAVGISINFLSQALCAFALIGMLKKANPNLKIIIGGGLVSSWLKQYGSGVRFENLVDQMIEGPGEQALLQALGHQPIGKWFLPDYSDFVNSEYLSPGFILPFSASNGCWWRRCAFCPERAEKRPFHPLPMTAATNQLQKLVSQTRPSLVHLLDNAISPALLKALVTRPPGAPWYGFVRIAKLLDNPVFCKKLAASGCVMLKIGLESGDQQVLNGMAKGICLKTAARVFNNLHDVGISTYVYLLFGTPGEDEAAAHRTMEFIIRHRKTVDYLNLAIFNLPLGSDEANCMRLMDFYRGDLALYRNFEHPKGWHRSAVRQFLDKKFKKHPAVQPILRYEPPVFTSNHAAFFSFKLHAKL